MNRGVIVLTVDGKGRVHGQTYGMNRRDEEIMARLLDKLMAAHFTAPLAEYTRQAAAKGDI